MIFEKKLRVYEIYGVYPTRASLVICTMYKYNINI